MSTFDGIVQEFPYIQIDYFCKNPAHPAPLACFLSHVHSDHLQGLESFRAPFIYCSAATKDLLLRIEKYPHRMNFAKGVLESRRLHYKHLAKLLKPIPLDTPTEIELTPRSKIRATLLDANHCAGSVMFLIEGDGNAILYTGDIRAESWWVNSLVRHPVLLPYTTGQKRLDKIYLDTTFARSSFIYRSFPSKGEGVSELLQKVALYTEDTVFYFRAWTFGYEDVWIALSSFLNTKIHVDCYQLNLYRSLKHSHTREAASLCGFSLGNRFVPGCLAEDESSRIHSCEPGVQCSAIQLKDPVYIIPIVCRAQNGSQIPEIGAGGGGGDLYQVHELELPDETALSQLEKLCLERIHDAGVLSRTRQRLIDAFRSKNKSLSLDTYGMQEEHDIPLDRLISILSRGRTDLPPLSEDPGNQLPKVIHFPYSRHSSYAELCNLVGAFHPGDIFPCTVDPLTWDEDVSMQSLFGHLCSGTGFVHDHYMREMLAGDDDLRARKRARIEVDSPQRSTQPTSSMVDSEPCGSLQDVQRYHSQINDAAPGRTEVCGSSSGHIPIPSSFETIENASHQSLEAGVNGPISISEPSQGTERAKRAEVRRAWQYLNKARPGQKNLQVGGLPSSWSEDYESVSDYKLSLDHGAESHNGCTSEDIDGNQVAEADLSPISQPSQPPSIPSSEFASQEIEADFDSFQHVPSEQTTESPRPFPNVGLNDRTVNSNGRADALSSLGRAASLRKRKAAYLAAREDTYESWASMSLVSAGNNHTEEEVEL